MTHSAAVARPAPTHPDRTLGPRPTPLGGRLGPGANPTPPPAEAGGGGPLRLGCERPGAGSGALASLATAAGREVDPSKERLARRVQRCRGLLAASSQATWTQHYVGREPGAALGELDYAAACVAGLSWLGVERQRGRAPLEALTALLSSLLELCRVEVVLQESRSARPARWERGAWPPRLAGLAQRAADFSRDTGLAALAEFPGGDALVGLPLRDAGAPRVRGVVLCARRQAALSRSDADLIYLLAAHALALQAPPRAAPLPAQRLAPARRETRGLRRPGPAQPPTRPVAARDLFTGGVELPHLEDPVEAPHGRNSPASIP